MSQPVMQLLHLDSAPSWKGVDVITTWLVANGWRWEVGTRGFGLAGCHASFSKDGIIIQSTGDTGPEAVVSCLHKLREKVKL